MVMDKVAAALKATQSSGFPTSRYIHLNVGGVKYMTSRETLTRYPDSMLGHMFTQERIPLAKDEKGRFLIDRDGTTFRHILNFLRDGTLCLLEGSSEYAQLLEEARFYQLEELVDKMEVIHLNVNGVHYSTTRAILTAVEGSLLAELFSRKRVPLATDDGGRYILNTSRDGHLLQYILSFLEDGDLHLPAKFEKFAELEEEIKHYKLAAAHKALEVNLCVGGCKYMTTRTVLTKQKGSLLWEIFTQTPIPLEKDPLGKNVIIQRDGDVFKYVLEFLRKGIIDISLAFDAKFLAEASYYKLRINYSQN